jgi:Tfp pilus assembly protein PilF
VRAADGYRQAREAAEKALALDPQLADAHVAMARIQNAYDWDWEAAYTSYRRAMALEPGSSLALRFLSRQALTQWSRGSATRQRHQ